MSTRNRRSAPRKPQGDFVAPDEFHAYGLAPEGNVPPHVDYESDDPTWNESQTDLSETDDLDMDDSEIETDDLGGNELGSTDLESDNLETDNAKTDSHTSKKPQMHNAPDLGTGSSASSHKEILTYPESMTFGWRGTHLKCGFVDREHLLVFIELTPKGPKMIKTRYDIAYWVGQKLKEFMAEKGLQHFDDNILQEFYGKLGLQDQGKDANAVWLIKRGIATKAGQYLKEQKKQEQQNEEEKKEGAEDK
ncbi:MAG: hypothetical protein OHK93_005240 [Ramalina farinacea]|uniref:Uncharacterized protein n=1 Tax=Ramalina farinacea TaxID=258253 RepID=A0AA43QXZ0_9LECA|nr:hypothetical protein [Ramalina farinacea]